MNWKLLLFFIVILITLIYFVMFFENRHEKVKFIFFHRKIDINLGFLLIGVFLDSAIITFLLLWLLAIL